MPHRDVACYVSANRAHSERLQTRMRDNYRIVNSVTVQ